MKSIKEMRKERKEMLRSWKVMNQLAELEQNEIFYNSSKHIIELMKCGFVKMEVEDNTMRFYSKERKDLPYLSVTFNSHNILTALDWLDVSSISDIILRYFTDSFNHMMQRVEAYKLYNIKSNGHYTTAKYKFIDFFIKEV